MTRASALAAEADKATIAMQLALARIGAETIAEAILIWSRMSPTQAARASDAWLGEALQMILSRRGQAQEIALAYYRLVRALRTGTTVPAPNEPPARFITMQRLRSEFEDLTADLVDPGDVDTAFEDATSGPEAPDTTVPHSSEDDAEIDLDRIEVEALDDLPDVARLLDELDDAVVEEAEVVLEALGPEGLRKKLDRIEERVQPDTPARDVDQRRSEAHTGSGRRQAAAAGRMVTNGARGLLWELHRRDRRAIGYVRHSLTGTPCGFCAMLISRGLRFAYASAESAEYKDGDKYHDNCNCVAIPVYTESEYASSPLYNLNREYEKLWPQVTKGLSGRDALNAWRRFINRRRASLNQQRPAQEAGTDTSAQEA